MCLTVETDWLASSQCNSYNRESSGLKGNSIRSVLSIHEQGNVNSSWRYEHVHITLPYLKTVVGQLNVTEPVLKQVRMLFYIDCNFFCKIIIMKRN